MSLKDKINGVDRDVEFWILFKRFAQHETLCSYFAVMQEIRKELVCSVS